jgi:hypothetical protein
MEPSKKKGFLTNFVKLAPNWTSAAEDLPFPLRDNMGVLTVAFEQRLEYLLHKSTKPNR